MPMRLRQILEDLVEGVPGARAAVMADWDGESVAAYTSGEQTDYEIKVVGAHEGIILNLARQLLKRLALGDAKEIAFLHENFHVITAPINQDYYLVLTLQAHTLPALAKPALKNAVEKIIQEIA